jgi:regulation of enolase protein 1 (concanavalin A-like superfamily)
MNTQGKGRWNGGPWRRRQALIRALAALSAIALAFGLMGVAPAQAGPPVWRDEFNTESLDPAWFWLNENPDGWRFTEPRGFLQIDTSAHPTGGENLLLRSGALGNFTIETRVLFAPGSNFQFAGLVVYQDQANFLQLGRAFCDVPDVCVGNGIYFDYIRDGDLVDGNFATATGQTLGEAYLRLELRGRRITAFYSANGEDWQRIGRHEVPPSFQVNGVGLTSSQNYFGEAIPADFDYFSLTGQPQPSSPFVGHWEAIDVDASDIRLTIGGPPSGPFRITWTESYISFCVGEAGIVRGTGWLNDADPHLLEADLHLECFTTGAQLDFHVTWRYDLPTDTISWTDWNGVIITWHRPGRPLPAPALFLRVNYGHDWVESFYEAGHVVRITVTDADGNAKATAQMYTQPRPEWGGEPGFHTEPDTWAEPGQPDIQPDDWVIGEVLDNGQVARVQIGDIHGAVDFGTDSITGTIDAEWIEGRVPVECLAWGSGADLPNKDGGAILTNGSDGYACAWNPENEWDVQAWQDIGVGYSTPEGHWVANAFHAEQWVMAFSADLPADFWPEGDHIYYFMSTGGDTTDPVHMLVSRAVDGGQTPIYVRFVLLRPFRQRAWTGASCEDVQAVHPQQPTRFVWGEVNPVSMSYEEVQTYFSSISVFAYPDGDTRRSAELVAGAILPYPAEWPDPYVCTLTEHD